MPELICTDQFISVKRPDEFNSLLNQAKSLIDRILPPSTTGPPPRSWSQFINADLKGHSRLRSVKRDGSAERVTIIAPLDARLELPGLRPAKGRRFQHPGGIE